MSCCCYCCCCCYSCECFVIVVVVIVFVSIYVVGVPVFVVVATIVVVSAAVAGFVVVVICFCKSRCHLFFVFNKIADVFLKSAFFVFGFFKVADVSSFVSRLKNESKPSDTEFSCPDTTYVVCTS